MARDGGLRWLFLDLNSYFASVEQQLTPELRGRPVVVAPVMTDATCAIAASYEAKRFGIRTGTPIHEARRRCPGLHVVPARHDLYVEFHHRVVAAIERHLPVTQVCSIDEVACRLSPSERHPEAAIALARRVKEGILREVGTCLRASVGLAPNRFLAKVASDMQKPDGLVVLTAADLPGRLMGLTLRDLPGIGPNMERRLNAAGVYDVAALWRLAPKHARLIWGSVEGERFWYALHGADLPADTAGRRRTVGHSHVLAPELRPMEEACRVARRLVLKAASRLRRLGHLAGALDLSVRLEDRRRWGGTLRIPRTQDSFALVHALDRLWRTLRDELGPVRIKKVAVTLHDLTPLTEVTPDLFAVGLAGPGTADRGMRLSRALDRIHQRYGRDAITLGMLPSRGSAALGAKVAFTRIPDPAEFRE